MIWIPFFIIALDQMTKRAALYFYEIGYDFSFWIIKNSFLIKNSLIWNPGITFGLFADSYYSTLLKVTIYCVIFYTMYTWYYAKDTYHSIAWGLILGGGISNGFDRIIFKAVLDFIFIQLPYFQSSVFNIADIAITIGGIMLLYDIIFTSKTKKISEPKK